MSNEYDLKMYELMERAYQAWNELAMSYPGQLTRGQKAALTRAWRKFSAYATELGYDPVVLSKKWSEP